MNLLKTGERVIPSKYSSLEDFLIYLRHIFAYNFALEQVKQSDYILDLGCGEGYGTKMLSEKASKIVGIDVDQQTIEHAKTSYKDSNIEFKTYDGSTIPFEDNTFDFVVSFQVIEHVHDDNLYISEISRVLKKGGIYILTTPNKETRLKPGQKPWNKYHIREYSGSDLQEKLNKYFNIIKVYGLNGNKEIVDIEFKRIEKNQRLASLDPFNIRRFLPDAIKIILLKLIRKDNVQKPEDLSSKFSINDYHISDEQIENSLDLLVVCTK